MQWNRALLVCVVLLVGVLPLLGDDFMYQKTYYVPVGPPARDIECRAEQRTLCRSKDHFGKKPAVLVVYMGDVFPDCTKRLNRYRDYQQAFARLGVEVIAISGEAAETHEVFKKGNAIIFPRMPDAEGMAPQEFG